MSDGRLHPWVGLASRCGTPALLGGMVPLVVIGVSVFVGLLDLLPVDARRTTGLVAVVALPLVAFGMAATYLPRPKPGDPRLLAAPIRGRCRAVNSPADRVPSHGTHAFAQTYAIDLAHEPSPGSRPEFGGWRAMRDPHEYPSFGQPVHAPADGTVARAVDGVRDHRCRSNYLGYLYMLVEGFALQLRGARGLLGNHLILRLSDGTYVVLAHLQRGSLKVGVGHRVSCGDVIAAVGNSGNTSEPHVHLQLMDTASPAFAAGLPFAFTDIAMTDALEAPRNAVPAVPGSALVFHAGVGAGHP